MKKERQDKMATLEQPYVFLAFITSYSMIGGLDPEPSFRMSE